MMLWRSEHACNCLLNEAAAQTCGGRGVSIFDVRGEAVIDRCILWNQSFRPATQGHVFCHREAPARTRALQSDIQGGWTGDGIIDADPGFVNPTVRDYSVGLESAARFGDSGTMGIRPRP